MTDHTQSTGELHPSIKEYVEAAYLHGLCVENLDTGELQPPSDIADVQWITDKLEALIRTEAYRLASEVINVTFNEVVDAGITPSKDEYDKMVALLRLQKTKLQSLIQEDADV